MWDALIQCAHLKSYTDLFHLFLRSFLRIYLIRVNNSVLVVLFELIIYLFEILEVVVHWVHGRKTLVALMLFFCLSHLALLKFLLLNVIDWWFDTKSVHFLHYLIVIFIYFSS
jgi:hypothetical protein